MPALEQYQHQHQHQEQVQVSPKQKQAVKARRSIFSPGEKLLCLVLSIVLAYFAVGVVQTQAQLFSVNKESVAIQKEIETETKLNKDLRDQVSELSMPERIIAKAQALGLSLNDQNVKAVE